MLTTGEVTPRFATHRDFGLPVKENISVYQFCQELFTSGVERNHLEGAQRTRGLWQIYMNNAEAKAKLYTDGITFRGKSVILYEQNPFSMNEESDDPEKKTM